MFYQLFSKHPFLVEREADEYVNYICDEVRERGRLHELRNEFGKACAPGGGCEYVRCTSEYKVIYTVRAEKNDNEADDFSAFLVGALEVPDAVHDVTVEPPNDESEKICESIIPVQVFVENPESHKRNQGIHYADSIVFDKVFHGGKNTIFAA